MLVKKKEKACPSFPENSEGDGRESEGKEKKKRGKKQVMATLEMDETEETYVDDNS